MKRPLMTHLFVVGWLVAPSGRDIVSSGDLGALQDAKAPDGCYPMNVSPVLLFHPNRALKGVLKVDVE